jgi:hypothetical protein
MSMARALPECEQERERDLLFALCLLLLPGTGVLK